jgi:amino acid transporter
VIVIYGLMAGSAEDLFWSLFKFSSLIFFLPYLALFPAFLKLRKTDAGVKRPYQAPGGKVMAVIMAVVCELFVVQGVVFFLWVPGQPLPEDTLQVVIGTVVTIAIGEILITLAARNKKTAEA